ncbi:MAG TPA: translation elongation factor Ts [Vicinamibacterales bacterium]|nr:translation elongation factor Ts [Vicinamibacterales bacterium]
MTEITATLVKTLRERTGAGIMACRTTLTETGGDLDAAIERLRDAQTSMAAKKTDRVAMEGLVAIAVAGERGAIVEVNCETDFVARGDEFRRAVSALGPAALRVEGQLEALAAAPSPDGEGCVADLVTRLSARTGEHVAIRRAAAVFAPGGLVSSYVHNASDAISGTIGVLVALDGPEAALPSIGKQVAMHVAASAPQWVAPGDIPPAVMAGKRAELESQARTTGKPAAVVEKMVEGRLRKFTDEVALLRQPFIIDPDRTLEQVLADASTAAGAPVRVRAFVRYRVGDTMTA